MTKKFFKLLLILGLISYSFPAKAKPTYIDGQDYTTLPKEVRNNQDVATLLNNNANKVQLLYFFSYGCPACNKFDPNFELWASEHKNKQLIIYKVPVSFSSQWEDLAKLYYVMQDLDPKEDLHSKIFTAIHEKNKELWQESEMEEFFLQNGYNADQFKQTFDSFNVNQKLKQADQLEQAYAINQSPTIIINGRSNSYKLIPGKNGKDLKDFFNIINYLIAKELK